MWILGEKGEQEGEGKAGGGFQEGGEVCQEGGLVGGGLEEKKGREGEIGRGGEGKREEDALAFGLPPRPGCTGIDDDTHDCNGYDHDDDDNNY